MATDDLAARLEAQEIYLTVSGVVRLLWRAS